MSPVVVLGKCKQLRHLLMEPHDAMFPNSSNMCVQSILQTIDRVTPWNLPTPCGRDFNDGPCIKTNSKVVAPPESHAQPGESLEEGKSSVTLYPNFCATPTKQLKQRLEQIFKIGVIAYENELVLVRSETQLLSYISLSKASLYALVASKSEAAKIYKYRKIGFVETVTGKKGSSFVLCSPRSHRVSQIES